MTEPQSKKSKSPPKLANHQLVVLAAYLVGAHANTADTEDVAVKVNEIAPGRFSWRKYKEQINIDTVRKRLWDATKPEKGAYLIGTEKSGWRLTKAGFDFARKQIKKSPLAQPKKERSSQIERTAKTRELRRMLSEAAFKKIMAARESEITKSDAERFFRLDDYVTGPARTAKIERFRIIAASNKDLLHAIDILSQIVGERLQ